MASNWPADEEGFEDHCLIYDFIDFEDDFYSDSGSEYLLSHRVQI